MVEKLQFKQFLTDNDIPFEEDKEIPEHLSVLEEDLVPFYDVLMKRFPEFKPFDQVVREDCIPKRVGDE